MARKQAHWHINTIYILKNTVNDVPYVGQTWQDLDSRWRGGYKGCHKLVRALEEIGYNNFYYEVLAFSATQETANHLEAYFIQKYNSINNGYNILTGGGNFKLPESVRLKISESHKRLPPRSEEHCKKISLAKMGDKNPAFGKKHSEEHKAKISKTLLQNNNFGRKLSLDQANEIRKLVLESKFYIESLDISKIAKNYKVSIPVIYSIIKNEKYLDKNSFYINLLEIGQKKKLLKMQKVKKLLADGKSGSEIAHEMGISQSAVCQLRKALK